MIQQQSESELFQSSNNHLAKFKNNCLAYLEHLEKNIKDSEVEGCIGVDDEDEDEKMIQENMKLNELRKNIYVETVELRKVNWDLQEFLNNIKDSTSHEKNEVDQIQLSIQNIYYQHKHLKSEIERCKDFHSKHENIDLVSMGEFYLSNPKMREVSDPHIIMIERLRDEEQRRLMLFITKTRLSERKLKLALENKKMKEDLERLDITLRNFIESTEPIQKTLQKY